MPQVTTSGGDWRKLEYDAIQLPLEYSGGVLITAGFIQEHYVHMGFQSPWNYDEVIELVFSDGICIKVHDLSELAEKRRAQAKPNQENMPEGLSEWIRKVFDLSYERR